VDYLVLGLSQPTKVVIIKAVQSIAFGVTGPTGFVLPTVMVELLHEPVLLLLLLNSMGLYVLETQLKPIRFLVTLKTALWIVGGETGLFGPTAQQVVEVVPKLKLEHKTRQLLVVYLVLEGQPNLNHVIPKPVHLELYLLLEQTLSLHQVTLLHLELPLLTMYLLIVFGLSGLVGEIASLVMETELKQEIVPFEPLPKWGVNLAMDLTLKLKTVLHVLATPQEVSQLLLLLESLLEPLLVPSSYWPSLLLCTSQPFPQASNKSKAQLVDHGPVCFCCV